MGLAYFPLSAAPAFSSSPPIGFAEPSCKFTLEWIIRIYHFIFTLINYKLSSVTTVNCISSFKLLGLSHFPPLNAETSTDIYFPFSEPSSKFTFTFHSQNQSTLSKSFLVFLALPNFNNYIMIIKWYLGLLLSFFHLLSISNSGSFHL